MLKRLVCLVALLVLPACQLRPQPTAGPAAAASPGSSPQEIVPLPNVQGSLKFAVVGDFGTGSSRQLRTAAQMARVHAVFPFELVVTTGDNIYGAERPADFVRKFEGPYGPLLQAGVKFYASLGNHDSREQRNYAPFNMNGRLYYTFKTSRQRVRFYALDSGDPDLLQQAWLAQALQGAGDDWKIVFFHHPLYSSGARHGSDVELRRRLEPLLVAHNASVVFAGHDHFYERVAPQQGITHFVVGAGGQLRRGNIDWSTGITARGFDTDNSFFVGEIDGDQLTFQAISRTGLVVDSGVIRRPTSRAATVVRDSSASAAE